MRRYIKKILTLCGYFIILTESNTVANGLNRLVIKLSCIETTRLACLHLSGFFHGGIMKNVSYVHFDTEMSKKEARDYLKNIDSHQYLPFITYTVDKKKWDGNHNKTGETRTISVASIKDNYVYQHFNNIISS